MAVNSNYDITALEIALCTEIDKIATVGNIFTDRPDSYATMNDFVIVKALTSVDDQKAFGDVITGIHIYVKNFTGGIRDSARQSALYSAIISVLPIETTKYRFHYSTNSRIVQDGLGYSVQIINLQTIIKHN